MRISCSRLHPPHDIFRPVDTTTPQSTAEPHSHPTRHDPRLRSQPLPAFLALSETLRQWRRTLGQTAILRIMPTEIAAELAQGTGEIKCQYRFRRDGRHTDWYDGHPYAEAGGVTLYVSRVLSVRDLIEIEVCRDGKRAWWSEATPQYIPVRLEGVAR